jgi:hypothetical protein
MNKTKKSNELFSWVRGKKEDAHIHEPILAGGSGKAERIGRAVAKDLGLSKEEIDKLFPKKAKKRPRRYSSCT